MRWRTQIVYHSVMAIVPYLKGPEATHRDCKGAEATASQSRISKPSQPILVYKCCSLSQFRHGHRFQPLQEAVSALQSHREMPWQHASLYGHCDGMPSQSSGQFTKISLKRKKRTVDRSHTDHFPSG
jgi:hypothetical protein